jgi:hypothetical protein
MSDSLGTALSRRYVIERELGRGGMATCSWRATSATRAPSHGV